MQAVLSQLNSVPGVIGSFASDMDGRLLAQAFPTLFDGAMLEEAARVIVDGAAGLDLATGRTELIELRFADANLLVRSFPGGLLVVLATKATNAHFLSLSASLAAAKIAKIRPLHPGGIAPAAPGAAPPATRGAPPQAVRGALPQGARDPSPKVTDSPLPAADAATTEGDPHPRKRVPPPTKGLDELRRRLSGGERPARSPAPTRPSPCRSICHPGTGACRATPSRPN